MGVQRQAVVTPYVVLSAVFEAVVADVLQVNFVGKILGQGGENVKRLQEMTGCRIAVLGRGSMKDKNKVHRTAMKYNVLFVQNLVRHCGY